MTEKKKILVVDDEKSMTNLLKKRIESASYDVSIASDGQEGLNKARLEMPDLIVADVMMPRLDGYHMCRLLKFDEKYKNIPIIMLTARAEEVDRIVGFELGADDYVAKPVSPRLLLARIKALMRRGGPEQESDRIVCGTLVIDRASREARIGEELVGLTSAATAAGCAFISILCVICSSRSSARYRDGFSAWSAMKSS